MGKIIQILISCFPSSQTLTLNKMETMHEFFPFVKEMLSAGPPKGSMKVYLVGGTFAVLGLVSGMMEVACSLFPDQ